MTVADVLPLRPVALNPPTDPPGPRPIFVDAKHAAALHSVGLRTWRAWDAAGRVPAPVRLSPGCVRWRLDELREWAEAGCPDRNEWQARRAARK